MNLICVDDEKNALINFYCDTKDHETITSIEFFVSPLEAIAYAKANPLDGAFLDMTMPEMDGLALGKELKKIQPNIELVYVTGYGDYALDAFKTGARAYLSKPYTQKELNDALLLLQRLTGGTRAPKPQPEVAQSKVFFKTFGSFDLLIDGIPVHFKNAKAKEMLALLVDRKGSSVTGLQAFTKLWEGREYDRVTSTYVRRTLRALKDQLEELGLSDLLISSRNASSINTANIICDYYEVMKGSRSFGEEYNGYYMSQYYWAEETIALIENKLKALNKP